MPKPIRTDLIASSLSELDHLWRAVALRANRNWEYCGQLGSDKGQYATFRERAFSSPVTISVITGPSADGEGYVLYARETPPQFIERERRV